jgi:hypothetical protein
MDFVVCRRAAVPTVALLVIALSVCALSSAGRAASQPGRSDRPSSIRLYVFDGGTLESDPARYQLTKQEAGGKLLQAPRRGRLHSCGRPRRTLLGSASPECRAYDMTIAIISSCLMENVYQGVRS